MKSVLEGTRVSPGGALLSLVCQHQPGQLGWEIRWIRVLLTESTAGLCLWPQGPFTLSTERNKFNRKQWRKNYFRTPCMAAARVFTWKGETKEYEVTGEVLHFSLDLWKWSFPSTGMYHMFNVGFLLKCTLTEQSLRHGVHCWSCENR